MVSFDEDPVLFPSSTPAVASITQDNTTALPITPHSLPMTLTHGEEQADDHSIDANIAFRTSSEQHGVSPTREGTRDHDVPNAMVSLDESAAPEATRGKDTFMDMHPPLWSQENDPENVAVIRSAVLPPSPPLTRVPSLESTALRHPEPTEESVATSADYTGASHAHGGTPNSVTRPSIVVRPHWLASDNALPDASDALKNSEMSSGLSHPLQADRSAPRTPPIWETVDPPPENNSGRSRLHPDSASARQEKSLVPKSSYYFGPPPVDSAYGTEPQGQFGVHHPREVLRVERDWSVGDIPQFTSSYPLELESRLSPTEYVETVNAINEVLISAYDLRYSALDNALAVFTLYLSRLILTSHYEKEMKRLHIVIDDLNARIYNPLGLNIVWPRNAAFMFLEIEYY